MRKIRNPRYAPEFLERKLNPSPTMSLMMAEVAPMSTAKDYSYQELEEPTFPPSDPYPPTGNGEPPDAPPTLPGGPSGPA